MTPVSTALSRSPVARKARQSTLALLTLGALALPAPAATQSLRGSKATVERMYWFAQSNRMQFHRTGESVEAAVRAGRLVPLPEIGRGYEVSGGVSYPYVTRETREFLESFAPQVDRACGAPLVVTSATRATSRQPRNAHDRSVHPTGVALDFRRPHAGPCLEWMRKALLELERRGFIEAIEERRPPHFHVVVLTPPGRSRNAPVLQLAVAGTPVPRVETISAGEVASASELTDASVPTATPALARLRESAADRRVVGTRAPGHIPFMRLLPVATSLSDIAGVAPRAAADTAPAGETPHVLVAPALAAAALLSGAEGAEREQYDEPASAPASEARTYTVRTGDTLWDVARKLHVPVDALIKANGLGKRALIKPGMSLKVPAESDHPVSASR